MIQKIRQKLQSIPFFKAYFEAQWVKKQFKNEIKLVNNTLKIDPANQKQSVLHFSINKSATQYVKKVLSKIGVSQKMIPIHLHEYAFHSKFPYLTSLNKDQLQAYSYLFKPKGVVYTAFGGFIKGIPNIEDYKVIICIRDPRDILVSGYFSLAYSHAVPPSISSSHEVFLKRRHKTREQQIDDFVIDKIDELLGNFENYRNILESSNIPFLVLKYEEMISDFESWLRKVFSYLEIEDSELFNQLIEEHQRTKPKVENKYEHIRKGIHGDYLNKLKPDTIRLLNSRFDTVLKYFEYE